MDSVSRPWAFVGYPAWRPVDQADMLLVVAHFLTSIPFAASSTRPAELHVRNGNINFVPTCVDDLEPAMDTIRPLRLLALGGLLFLAPAMAHAQATRVTVELEGGPVWQSYNDVEIPNDGSATRFSLRHLAGSGPWPAGRLYVTWRPGPRHELRLLLAPLSISATGIPEQPIQFVGASYQAGRATAATYTFNSYRFTYRYRVHEGERTTAWIGFTAKVRDAVIALRQGTTASRKTDLGFVPLLHLAGDWRFAPRWALGLDADALAGGPGRAEDVAVKLAHDLADRWTIRTGYRMVEGGADVPEVYTFAWLHYAVVSVAWRW